MVAPESSLSLIILNLIRHIASSPLLNCLGGDEVTQINRKSWGWRFQLMGYPAYLAEQSGALHKPEPKDKMAHFVDGFGCLIGVDSSLAKTLGHGSSATGK